MVAATTGATLRDQDAPTRWRLRVGWVHGQGVFRNRQRRSSASDRPALPRERRLGVAWPIAATQRGRGVAATRVLAPGKRAHGKPRRFACPARARADQRSRSRPPALARRQKPACTPRRSRGRLRSGTVSRFRVRLPKGKPRFFVRQPSPRVCDTAPPCTPETERRVLQRKRADGAARARTVTAAGALACQLPADTAHRTAAPCGT